ncbi:MAG TPA: extracellular solute-binding protein [Streptosporangiaceae bacterium]|nr:extracellular solute-binding protein [Streptosporangiaceae bacterium]
MRNAQQPTARRAGRRVALSAVSLAAGALALSACGSSGGGSSSQGLTGSTSKPVTLSFEYQQPTPGAPNWLLGVEQGFEKLHPNVHFQTADTLPSNDYLAKLSSQVGAGTAPDLFIGWTYQRLTPYAKGGRLFNLKPYLAKSAAYNEVTPFALASATVNGGLYAVPLTEDAEIIYYNKAVFKKAGITVPTSYAQFLSDVQALKKSGVAPIALGNTDSFNGSIIYTMLAERLGGFNLYKAAVVSQKTPFNNPAFVKAGTYLQQLVKMGAFNSNYGSESIGYAASLLTSNKAGMFVNGTWETYALYQGLGKNLGWFTLPPIAGGQDNSAQQLIELPNNAISVSANSPHKAEAVKFIEYLETQGVQLAEAKAGNSIASKYPLPASVADPVTASIHSALAQGTPAMAPWDTLLGVAPGEQFDNATQTLYSGKSPSGVLSGFDALLKTSGATS